MAERLIITNGEVAAERLREAMPTAEVVPWDDPLHDGPVPGGLTLEALSLVRAQFLAKEFGRTMTDVLRRFASRDALARNQRQYQHIELWFEHDLYDQLQLVQLLDFFEAEGRSDRIFLIQASDYLGTQNSDALKALASRAQALTRAQFDTATRVWTAFTAASLQQLSALAWSEIPQLPHLAAALRRLLAELPSLSTGLGLTEERILAVLVREQRTAAELFAETQRLERARFLGDLGFFRRLDGLAFVPKPLIAGLSYPATRCAGGPETQDYKDYAQARLRLTDTGRAALAGHFDHALENAVNRWLGGTQISAKSLWRRDGDGRVAAPPAPAGQQVRRP